jgi:hypothetical protein
MLMEVYMSQRQLVVRWNLGLRQMGIQLYLGVI